MLLNLASVENTPAAIVEAVNSQAIKNLLEMFIRYFVKQPLIKEGEPECKQFEEIVQHCLEHQPVSLTFTLEYLITQSGVEKSSTLQSIKSFIK